MCTTQTGESPSDPAAALALMEEALELLDGWDGGLAVGAQLDLAICRLRSLLGLSLPAATDEAMIYGADPSPDPSRSFAA
jgi:hypothetical protein